MLVLWHGVAPLLGNWAYDQTHSYLPALWAVLPASALCAVLMAWMGRYPDFAPYAGVGYTSNRGGSGLSFVVDAGVMFQGGSLVTLTSNGGGLSADPTFQADLDRERADIKRDVDNLRFFPVVKLGVAYRF